MKLSFKTIGLTLLIISVFSILELVDIVFFRICTTCLNCGQDYRNKITQKCIDSQYSCKPSWIKPFYFSDSSCSPKINPVPTDEENNRKLISALSVYDTDKLNEEDKKLLSGLKWPELKKYPPGDVYTEVYLIDCEDTDMGIKLSGIPYKINNVENIADITIASLAVKHYGGFPNTKEITNYEKVTGTRFKHADSGISGAILEPNGNLKINFYDSVRAYGGGSSRVACITNSVYFTALQFPTIKSITMCIDQYPNETNFNCSHDFQP